MHRISIPAIISACFLAVAVPAVAQAQAESETRPFRLGGLTCDTDARVGLIVGSTQTMRCVFVASGTGHRYGYRGTIRRVGLDVGVTRGGRLYWGVFSRHSRISKATLRGNYIGASASASAGLGLGANVLIGGSRRTTALQPLSTEGQTGVNLALGVASLVLR